jgi:hypothetical protein
MQPMLRPVTSDVLKMTWTRSRGRRLLQQAVIAAGLFVFLGASARWYEFKGLYVNMPVSEVKKMGFTCMMGQIYEVCKPTADNKRFATIGGAPVKEIGVVIERDKVNLIRLETIGAYWDELKEAMNKNYGKPKKDGRLSVLWDRGGAEFISAGVSKGKVEVIFGYSEFDSEKRIKERAKKAEKDF